MALNPLFDDIPKSGHPLLFDEGINPHKAAEEPNVSALFGEPSDWSEPAPIHPNPLFTNETDLKDLPPAPKAEALFEAAPLKPIVPVQPAVTPIMGEQPLDVAPVPKLPVSAEAAFSEDIDPLAERALSFLKQKYPQCSDEDYRHWKGVLNTLFPLTADNWMKIGQSGLETAQRIMAEISEVTNRYSEISPTSLISKVATDAQQAAQSSHSLLSRITHHFDEGRARGQIMAVIGGLKSLIGKLDSVILLAAQVTEQFRKEVPILESIEHIAGGEFQSGMLVRRRELLLTSAQQMAMANQQAEVLKKEIVQARMSADEVLNVTLPALGFSAAIS